MMKPLTIAVLAAALSGCVPYPEGMALPEDATSSSIVTAPFMSLDPGASEQTSLHFKVRAYGADTARRTSEQAEACYQRIMVDTNLFSFMPSGLYQIVVFGSQDEYRRKTNQPSWSGGVSYGNAIYSFVGGQLNEIIAHEMTHLIFYEFMGRSDSVQRWVNEGLAVYEEAKAAGGSNVPVDLFGGLRPLLRAQPLTMDQMIHLVPASEKEKTVSLWYAESESLVQFMIERGGRLGFSQFLQGLKDGRNFDQAIGSGFIGVWRNLSDLTQSWQTSIQ